MFVIFQIFLLVQKMFCPEIIYQFNANVQDQDGWIITNGLSNKFSICFNNQYIFGGVQGFNMNTKLKKSIENMLPLYKMNVKIVFQRIDFWNFDYLRVTVDGFLKFSKTYRFQSLPNLCGATNYDDEVENINFEFPHVNNRADFEIFAIDNGDNDEFWSIQNFQISLYMCSNNCISCDETCLGCKIGYQVINGQCEEFCGDSYVTSQEECDDGNTIQYDGCYQCMYQCIEGCNICDKGNCLLKCQIGYIFDGEICITICGDSYVTSQEECDDGNQQNNDGCYNCNIEQNWICNQLNKYQPSQCTYSLVPKLQVTYLNMTLNKQYLTIQFNQKVKTLSQIPLSNSIILSINNLKQENFIIKMINVVDLGDYFDFPEYVIEVEIFQLLDIKPILSILINNIIISEKGAFLESMLIFQGLEFPSYLNQQQTNNSLMLFSINKYIIISLAVICGISFINGNSDLIFEVLNLLYLKIKFPNNLLIYFDVYNLISITPILDLTKIKQFQNFLYHNFNPSQGKFFYYQQNADLVSNMSIYIIQLIICLILIHFIKQAKQLIYYYIFSSRYFYWMSVLATKIYSQWVCKFSNQLYFFCQNVMKLEKLLHFKGIKQIFLLNGWDLIFKIFLFINSIDISNINIRDLMQMLLSFPLLLCYFFIVLNAIKSKSYKFWTKKEKFQTFCLQRQIFQLGILVYIQDSEVIQLVLMSATSLWQLLLIYNNRQLLKGSNYLIQFRIECSVLFFTLSSLAYIQDFEQFILEDKKIVLGWIHIFVLSLGVQLKVSQLLISKIKQRFWKKTQQIPIFGRIKAYDIIFLIDF